MKGRDASHHFLSSLWLSFQHVLRPQACSTLLTRKGSSAFFHWRVLLLDICKAATWLAEDSSIKPCILNLQSRKYVDAWKECFSLCSGENVTPPYLGPTVWLNWRQKMKTDIHFPATVILWHLLCRPIFLPSTTAVNSLLLSLWGFFSVCTLLWVHGRHARAEVKGVAAVSIEDLMV